jgi:hypothetical protein
MKEIEEIKVGFFASYVGNFAKCKSCMNCKKDLCILRVENL